MKKCKDCLVEPAWETRQEYADEMKKLGGWENQVSIDDNGGDTRIRCSKCGKVSPWDRPSGIDAISFKQLPEATQKSLLAGHIASREADWGSSE